MKKHSLLLILLVILVAGGAGGYMYLTSLEIPAPSEPVEKVLDNEQYIQ